MQAGGLAIQCGLTDLVLVLIFVKSHSRTVSVSIHLWKRMEVIIKFRVVDLSHVSEEV